MARTFPLLTCSTRFTACVPLGQPRATCDPNAYHRARRRVKGARPAAQARGGIGINFAIDIPARPGHKSIQSIPDCQQSTFSFHRPTSDPGQLRPRRNPPPAGGPRGRVLEARRGGRPLPAEAPGEHCRRQGDLPAGRELRRVHRPTPVQPLAGLRAPAARFPLRRGHAHARPISSASRTSPRGGEIRRWCDVCAYAVLSCPSRPGQFPQGDRGGPPLGADRRAPGWLRPWW